MIITRGTAVPRVPAESSYLGRLRAELALHPRRLRPLPRVPVLPETGPVGALKRRLRRHAPWTYYPARWAYHLLYRFLYLVFTADFRTLAKLGCLALWFVPPRLGRLEHHPPRPFRPDWPQPRPARPAWPRISIVTPCYNQAGFLEASIASVLGQEYPDLEYIVQDGGSRDGTLALLERYAGRLDWASQPDSGQAEAINRGFRRSSGEIMAYLNSDDLLLPGALQRVAERFARHPEIDVLYGHRVLLDAAGREIGRWLLPAHDDGALLLADFVPQESLFWRRRVWDRAGGCLDESFRFAMDWELLLRFLGVGGRMLRVPAFLGAFRVHGEQKTQRLREVGEAEIHRLRERTFGRRLDPAEVHSGLIFYYTRHLLRHYAYRCRLLRA